MSLIEHQKNNNNNKKRGRSLKSTLRLFSELYSDLLHPSREYQQVHIKTGKSSVIMVMRLIKAEMT